MTSTVRALHVVLSQAKSPPNHETSQSPPAARRAASIEVLGGGA
jgi:hypothetical protein